ncbi:hypothetical protein D3C79_751130 [compost metagenome]
MPGLVKALAFGRGGIISANQRRPGGLEPLQAAVRLRKACGPVVQQPLAVRAVHAGECAGDHQLLYGLRCMAGHFERHHAAQGEADQVGTFQPQVVEQCQHFQCLGMGRDTFGRFAGRAVAQQVGYDNAVAQAEQCTGLGRPGTPAVAQAMQQQHRAASA